MQPEVELVHLPDCADYQPLEHSQTKCLTQLDRSCDVWLFTILLTQPF